MTRRKSTTPRKLPRQARAHATVEAILGAATYILTRSGWDGFTTNAVAARAGVNIASLYQYFPNKESIVLELHRRHAAEARSRLEPPSPALDGGLSFRETLVLGVRAGIEEHRAAPRLHRVFTEELPRSMQVHVENEEHAQRQLAVLVRRFQRNVPDPDLAAFVARVTIHAVIHEAAARRPELLERPEFEAELVLLLERYLRRPARRTPARRARS